MQTAVVGGAPIGGHPSARIPRTIEDAAAKRRYWDRFHNEPQESAPIMSFAEVNAFALRVRPVPGQRAIEVGCGRGTFAAAMTAYGLETTGYDWSEVAVAQASWAWADPLLSFEVHDFLGGGAPAGVEDGSVDVLACRVTLQYLDVGFWEAARRWLRPGTGVMYVTLPVNERQRPGKEECGLPHAVIERLREEWEWSQRWDLDAMGSYTALALRGPR